MEYFEIHLRPDAASAYQALEFFERLEIWDVIDRFRVGLSLDADYEEVDDSGLLGWFSFQKQRSNSSQILNPSKSGSRRLSPPIAELLHTNQSGFK